MRSQITRQPFIPHDAPMTRFRVIGTPVWTPIWDKDTDRYNILFHSNIRIDLLERGFSVLIKAGFVCDGASVPKRFWDSIGSPYASRYLLAAVLHDGLYQTEYLQRDVCDAIFVEFMKDLGVDFIRREFMYLAVRWGGWKPWDAKTPQSLIAAEQFVRIVDLNELPDFPAVSWEDIKDVTRIVSQGMLDIATCNSDGGVDWDAPCPETCKY